MSLVCSVASLYSVLLLFRRAARFCAYRPTTAKTGHVENNGPEDEQEKDGALIAVHGDFGSGVEAGTGPALVRSDGESQVLPARSCSIAYFSTPSILGVYPREKAFIETI